MLNTMISIFMVLTMVFFVVMQIYNESNAYGFANNLKYYERFTIRSLG